MQETHLHALGPNLASPHLLVCKVKIASPGRCIALELSPHIRWERAEGVEGAAEVAAVVEEEGALEEMRMEASLGRSLRSGRRQVTFLITATAMQPLHCPTSAQARSSRKAIWFSGTLLCIGQGRNEAPFHNGMLYTCVGGQSATVGMLPPSDSEDEGEEEPVKKPEVAKQAGQVRAAAG